MVIGRFRLLAAVSGSAWLLLAACSLMAIAVSGTKLNPRTLQGIGATTISGFLACLMLFWFFGILESKLRGGPLAATAAAACMVASAAQALISALLRLAVMGGSTSGPNPRWQTLFANSLWGTGQFVLCSGLYFTARYWLELQDQREKALRATALAHQAQLQMLRCQLNPHFLFNTLNSIRAMVLEDPDKCRQMITRLSDLLRYSLAGETEETTIAGEIEALRAYLEIQHIRFEQKLNIIIEIDPSTEAIVIPCFVIHGLVENAIKYGMDTSPMPLKVRIQVTRQDGRIQIRVRNSGRLATEYATASATAWGTGTGLRNIVQRLELGFRDRYSFEIHERDGWVNAEIDLALETTPA